MIRARGAKLRIAHGLALRPVKDSFQGFHDILVVCMRYAGHIPVKLHAILAPVVLPMERMIFRTGVLLKSFLPEQQIHPLPMFLRHEEIHISHGAKQSFRIICRRGKALQDHIRDLVGCEQLVNGRMHGGYAKVCGHITQIQLPVRQELLLGQLFRQPLFDRLENDRIHRLLLCLFHERRPIRIRIFREGFSKELTGKDIQQLLLCTRQHMDFSIKIHHACRALPIVPTGNSHKQSIFLF